MSMTRSAEPVMPPPSPFATVLAREGRGEGHLAFTVSHTVRTR
ncbi:hypothetical protein [Streptomyces sp. MBT65]|nr:hypothetical protein [Streptomyces sp. MBT65]